MSYATLGALVLGAERKVWTMRGAPSLGARFQYRRGFASAGGLGVRPRTWSRNGRLGRLGQFCPPYSFGVSPPSFSVCPPSFSFCPPAPPTPAYTFCPPAYCPPSYSLYCPPGYCPPAAAPAPLPPDASVLETPQGYTLMGADGSVIGTVDTTTGTVTMPNGTQIPGTTPVDGGRSLGEILHDAAAIFTAAGGTAAAAGNFALATRNAVARAGYVIPTYTPGGQVVGWVNSNQYRLPDGTIVTPTRQTYGAGPGATTRYALPSGAIVSAPPGAGGGFLGGLFSGGGTTLLLLFGVALVMVTRR